MRRNAARRLLGAALAVSVAAVACAGADEDRPSATRTTLDDGTLVLAYHGFGATTPDTLHPDLQIGTEEGPDWEAFGNIMGVEAAPDGSIYVLDFQAASIRVFGPDGQYIRSIGRRGEGPGEFRLPLGLLWAPSGTIWVRDQGTRMILVMSADGHELQRYSLPTTGTGSNQWDGVIDTKGNLWQSWRYTIEAPPPAGSPGLAEGKIAHYVRSFNPETAAHDSVFVADETVRALTFRQGQGYASSKVPFDPERLITVDHEGAVWSALSNSYRLTRAGPITESRLAVESDYVGPQITAEVKEQWALLLRKAQVGLSIPDRPRAIARIFIDDNNQLWVQRQVTPEGSAHFDVFDAQGKWLGALLLNERLPQVPAPVVRNGYIYAVTLGELDVPRVSRAPLPSWAS